MIKRFNPDFSLSISHELAYMRETPEGGYVAHGDYATLFSEMELVKADRDAQQKRADALLAEGALMLKLLTDISDNHVEYFSEGECGMFAGVPLDYVSEINMYVSRDVNAENPFPATDAALAAIEARGVEKAIDLLLNKFSGTGHIGVPVMALESLAIELREAK
ncbi:hypothetical protein [Serratia quinivorans]|uniref:hypothetical protein n=1 Tax=Serratia quinivorans TaxID=137545 RepID=UPI00217A49D5|nr:hypothetical protein [Serratia quinivorans]CAI0910518.1 Uncharacterised protein [Serratia quinivorans]